jgi:uncharacterized membrane protein YsdA (DUF1294 family)
MTILFYIFSFDYNGFTITGYDKYLSKIRRRIGENTFKPYLGGTIGTRIAMLFFRHKTAKTSFLWSFWNTTTSNCDYLSSLQ